MNGAFQSQVVQLQVLLKRGCSGRLGPEREKCSESIFSNPASSVFCVHKNPKYTACQRDTPKTPTMQKGDEENETKRGIRYPRYYREISGEQRRSETYRKQVQKQRLQVQKRLLPHYDISRANNQGKR